MKLITLIKRAQHSASTRGHRLRWVKYKNGLEPEYATGTCIKCGKQVQCLTWPQPNEINIGGEAVALNCKPTIIV